MAATDRPRRLRRDERREQILAAATKAFASAGGFAPTSLDDVAAESGVTRMILYRHFESKTDLYQAVLDRAAVRLHDAAMAGSGLGDDSVPGMLAWAAAEPDAFRLLFHYAAREAEFRDGIDEMRAAMAGAIRPHIAEVVRDDAWADWAANLATTTVIEGIMAWLDAGRPDPGIAAGRIVQAVDGIYRAVGG